MASKEGRFFNVVQHHRTCACRPCSLMALFLDAGEHLAICAVHRAMSSLHVDAAKHLACTVNDRKHRMAGLSEVTMRCRCNSR